MRMERTWKWLWNLSEEETYEGRTVTLHGIGLSR